MSLYSALGNSSLCFPPDSCGSPTTVDLEDPDAGPVFLPEAPRAILDEAAGHARVLCQSQCLLDCVGGLACVSGARACVMCLTACVVLVQEHAVFRGPARTRPPASAASRRSVTCLSAVCCPLANLTRPARQGADIQNPGRNARHPCRTGFPSRGARRGQISTCVGCRFHSHICVAWCLYNAFCADGDAGRSTHHRKETRVLHRPGTYPALAICLSPFATR